MWKYSIFLSFFPFNLVSSRYYYFKGNTLQSLHKFFFYVMHITIHKRISSCISNRIRIRIHWFYRFYLKQFWILDINVKHYINKFQFRLCRFVLSLFLLCFILCRCWFGQYIFKKKKCSWKWMQEVPRYIRFPFENV